MNRLINWLALKPTPADLEQLQARLLGAVPVRQVCRALVEITLSGYPWDGRDDLIPVYHPSETQRKGQYLALPLPDPQKVRPTVWQVTRLKQIDYGENPVQGRFQVFTLEIAGKQIDVAAGVSLGDSYRFPRLDFSKYNPEDLAYLTDWFSDIFSKPLQAVLEEACKKGHVQGQILGGTFLPAELAAVTPRALRPFFEALDPSRPWVSVDEILSGLPEFSGKNPELARALIRAALKDSPYRALGGERWTSSALYESLNREVPRGLPAARIRSKLNIWTDEDARDLAGYTRKRLPPEARQALDELEAGDVLAAPTAKKWLPPASPAKLPTLNYLHITQAYFPVDGLIHAFAPEVRLAFVQFIEGSHQPFLLDRDTGQLKALRPEILRDRILESNIPAGTYLWLEYQGGENYRIAPRPLSTDHMVPCKLAYMQDGQLHIEHTQIPMFYEGDPYVFKANMRFEDIEALFAEARQANISVRDAIIYAVQELCEGDPRNRAHRTDIFNAVFLKRMCSPNSVSLLLYTQPCFEQLGEGFFRYRPIAPDAGSTRPIQNETKPEPVSAPRPKLAAPDPMPVLQREEPILAASVEPALAPEPSILGNALQSELQKLSQRGQQAIQQGRFVEAEELARQAERVHTLAKSQQQETEFPDTDSQQKLTFDLPQAPPIMVDQNIVVVTDPVVQNVTNEPVFSGAQAESSLPVLIPVDENALTPELELVLQQESLVASGNETLHPTEESAFEIGASVPPEKSSPILARAETPISEPVTKPQRNRLKFNPPKKPFYWLFLSRFQNWLQNLFGGRCD